MAVCDVLSGQVRYDIELSGEPITAIFDDLSAIKTNAAETVSSMEPTRTIKCEVKWTSHDLEDKIVKIFGKGQVASSVNSIRNLIKLETGIEPATLSLEVGIGIEKRSRKIDLNRLFTESCDIDDPSLKTLSSPFEALKILKRWTKGGQNNLQ